MDSGSNRYDDIIDLPHHVSLRHAHMSVHDRAAQFAPFAALTGYDDAIGEAGRRTVMKIELTEEAKAELDINLRSLMKRIAEQPGLTVTYFVHDTAKTGGQYVTVSGRLKSVNEQERSLLLVGGLRIDLDEVLTIEPLGRKDGEESE